MVKEIDLVKKFISLLLISVCLGDTLIVKDKTKHNGGLLKYSTEIINHTITSSGQMWLTIVSEYNYLGSGYIDNLFIE